MKETQLFSFHTNEASKMQIERIRKKAHNHQRKHSDTHRNNRNAKNERNASAQTIFPTRPTGKKRTGKQ